MRSDASIPSAVPALEKTVSLIVRKLLITVDDDIRGSFVGVQGLLRHHTEAAGEGVGGDGGDDEADADGEGDDGHGREGRGQFDPDAPAPELAGEAEHEGDDADLYR